jgi:arylsulfatase A-like enzyme
MNKAFIKGSMRDSFSKKVLTIILLSVLGCNLIAATNTSRLNVVFILADDLGYMDIGANNPKSFYETPNIDGLAAKGMRFTTGYAACPVCSPTRASIMTGKYPVRTGITDYIGQNRPGKLLPAPNQKHLALEEVTIAETLRDAGYTNFFAGKWHLGNVEYSPNAQGFGPNLVGINQFFYPPSDLPLPDKTNDGKTTDRIADEAVKFIDANKDRPFFAYLPFLAVHIPITAKPELVEKYERKRANAPPEAFGTEGKSKVRLVQNHAAYAAMLEQMDSAIGRVLAALEKNGLTERTIVIFTSDNGGLATAEGSPTSNLPLRGGKGWLYEGGVRVPLIVRLPGLTKAGATCDNAIVSTDYYPTLLQLLGLPAMPKQHLDGVSFAPLLKGEHAERGPIFWHYPHYGNQGGAPGSAIRDGDWKLIEWFETEKIELFNLRDDPSEAHDVAAANPETVKKLQAKLIAWRKEVKAIMPTRNPDYSETATNPPRKPVKKKSN